MDTGLPLVVARVTKTGGFLVHQVFYSAASQMIGQRLRVHVYDDRIEAFLGAMFRGWRRWQRFGHGQEAGLSAAACFSMTTSSKPGSRWRVCPN